MFSKTGTARNKTSCKNAVNPAHVKKARKLAFCFETVMPKLVSASFWWAVSLLRLNMSKSNATVINIVRRKL